MLYYTQINAHRLAHYALRRRRQELPIASAMAELVANQIISRFVKKQQMRWSPRGVHYPLQVRTVLHNDELAQHFRRWHPGFAMNDPIYTRTALHKTFPCFWPVPSDLQVTPTTNNMPAISYQHNYPFDPTCNMNLEQLLAINAPQPPTDFADFWRLRHAAALKLSAKPRIELAAWQRPQYRVYDLCFVSTDAVEIGGWLLVPKDGQVRRGVIFGHGYGGCELPEELLAVDEAVLLFPCFRGIGRSPMPGVSPDPNSHVLHDIQDRQRYILGGCVEDLWLAVSSLLALFPEVAGQVAYSGISFGGGIGALAVPWDARIGRLHLQVPTFGNHALRLTLPCVGSGESVRCFRPTSGFHVMDTLAYYDAACAARFLRIPVLVAAALFDPAVPPPGQFAIFNAIAEPLKRLFVLQAGHFDDAGQVKQLREMHQEVAGFFMEP